MTPLLAFLEQAALFIVVLGLVVSFHELGHFLVAKAFRVRVEVFSIGFGRRLFGRRIGETDYRIALIPLGGYVLMGGETGEDPPPPRHPRDFEAKPAWARFCIMAAGPVFSALLSVLLMWAVFMGGIEVPAYLRQPPRVGVVAKGSPAEAGGLRTGDLVIAAGGREVSTWESLAETVMTSPGARLDMTVERAGERLVLPVDIKAQGKHAIGWMGADPCGGVVVREVSPDSPAMTAGVMAGDILASIDGTDPCSPVAVTGLIQAGAGAPLRIGVNRAGERLELTVTPRRDEKAKAWRIGIGPQIETVKERFAPHRALAESCRYNWDKGLLIVNAVGKLLTGRLSVRTMSGPLEMASMTEETADAGLLPLVAFVALISLNLAIFNLLPIPILDGGRMVLLIIEALRGRDLERRTKEWILQAGLAMIVALMVVVLVMDAIKKLEG